MSKLLGSLALASVAVLGAVAIPAQAQVSSFTFVPIGSSAVTYTPGPPFDVSTATSITVPGPYATNGTGKGFFVGLTNGHPVFLTPDVFSTGSIADFTLTYAGDTFTFTGDPSGGLLLGTPGVGTASATWTELGTLTDSKGLITNPGGAAGQLSLAAIQNLNPFSTPNASFTFSSQVLTGPPPGVPEPGDLAMFVSLGLSGVSFIAIRRRK